MYVYILFTHVHMYCVKMYAYTSWHNLHSRNIAVQINRNVSAVKVHRKTIKRALSITKEPYTGKRAPCMTKEPS